jgi:hypothetical protein
VDRRAPRFAVTCTPEHAPWLNIIEQWVGILTRKLLRRGDFASPQDLENQITEFTIGYNETAHPWKWRYDTDAEHARYLERHPREDNRGSCRPADPHPAGSAAAEPAGVGGRGARLRAAGAGQA